MIDTLWVTLQLLKDRDTLGLPYDNKFHDVLVNQFKVNALRIYSLNDKGANISNFLASKELYLRYYRNYHCKGNAGQLLEDAILKNNYRQFVLSCILM